MKKLLLSAAMICTMAVSAMAQGTVTTTYVKASDKNAINNAINEAIGAGNTHIVVLCKSLNETNDGEGEVADASTTVNLGTTPKIPSCGTLVVRSNQTDINNLPLLQLEFGANAIDASVGYPSLVLENLALDQRTPGTGAGYIVSNKNNDNFYGMDSCVIKNCDIKSGRAIFREENQKGSTDPNAVDGRTSHHIKKFVFEGNKTHQMCILQGNGWRPFYFVSIPDEMYMNNNIFYDMPYASQLINFHATALSDGTATTWNIYNNTFFMSSARYAEDTKGPNLVMLNAGAFVDPNTQFNVYNNLFLGEERGLYAKPEDNADYHIIEANETDGVKLVYCIDADKNVAGALTTSHNYFSKYYMAPGANRLDAEDTPHAMDLYEDLSSEEYTWSFDDCHKPDNSDYRTLKTNPFYTAGASSINDFEGNPIFSIPTCVGAPIMYLDEFPQEAQVVTKVEGEYYGEPTISIAPEKETYMKGDKITITINDPANTALNKFNNFKGWSGDMTSEEKSFQIELTEAKEYVFTATMEKNAEIGNVLAAWYTATGKDMKDIEAQIGAGMLKAFGADTVGIGKDSLTNAWPLQTAALPYVEKAFQTRTSKFGEDPVEAQVCTYNLRTAACSRDYNRDYALIQLNTTGKINVKAELYRGSDSNASKEQIAYWSIDSINYTKIASLALDTLARDAKFGDKDGKLFGWGKMVINLPEECNGQEKVFIKLQGAVKGAPETEEDIVYNPGGFESFEKAHASDVFEYITNIVVTADNFDLSAIDEALKTATDTIAYLKTDMAKNYINAAIEKATAAKETVTNQEGIDNVIKDINLAIKEAVLIYDLTPLTVTESVVYNVNPTDYETYKAAGWMSHTEATPGSSSKKATITPNVAGDVTGSAVSVTGINTKEGNRNSYMAVIGVASISAYFGYNKGNIGALDVYGTDITATYETPAANTTGVATLTDLDASKTYYIRVHATADCPWYAVKFIAGAPDGINAVTVDGAMLNGKFVQNGQLVIMKNGKAYNALGIQK